MRRPLELELPHVITNKHGSIFKSLSSFIHFSCYFNAFEFLEFVSEVMPHRNRWSTSAPPVTRAKWLLAVSSTGTLTSRVDLAKKSAIRGIGRILGIDVGGSKTVHHQDHGSLGIESRLFYLYIYSTALVLIEDGPKKEDYPLGCKDFQDNPGRHSDY